MNFYFNISSSFLWSGCPLRFIRIMRKPILKGWINRFIFVFVINYCPIFFNLLDVFLIWAAELIPFGVEIFPVKEGVLDDFGSFGKAHFVSWLFHHSLKAMNRLICLNIILLSIMKLLFHNSCFLIFRENTIEQCLLLLSFILEFISEKTYISLVSLNWLETILWNSIIDIWFILFLSIPCKFWCMFKPDIIHVTSDLLIVLHGLFNFRNLLNNVFIVEYFHVV